MSSSLFSCERLGVVCAAAPVYERDVLRGDEGLDASSRSTADEEDTFGMTSDSESVSLEPMVIECIDFLKAVLDCHIGRVAKLMLRAAKLPDFLHLMVRYMQMKDADAFKAEVSTPPVWFCLCLLPQL